MSKVGTEKYSNYPPYTPISSLGRELGITFAFIGACLVTIAIYSVFWRGMCLFPWFEPCVYLQDSGLALYSKIDCLSTPCHFTSIPAGTRTGTNRWKAHQRRSASEDLARRRAFHSRLAPDNMQFGTTASVTTGSSDRGRVREKMLDRLAMEDRVGLGTESGRGDLL